MFVTGASLTVPLFGIVLRKGYGLGAQSMIGGGFHASFFTAAWPTFCAPGGRPMPTPVLASVATAVYSVPTVVLTIRSGLAFQLDTLVPRPVTMRVLVVAL
jgi:hypothetical protein